MPSVSRSKEAKDDYKIPVLPISWEIALPLLSALAGPLRPKMARRTAHHLSRRSGPAKVHLKVTSNWDLKPVNDVIATMRGSDDPDRWVIRGNHFDAWVNGADDPLSGMSAVLEEARMLGELHKQGWNPKRTIIYCAWDGEEPGLLGSTEWVETHGDELQKHAVAYINSDSNGRGFFHASGSHDLEKLTNDVVREINDPEKILRNGKGLVSPASPTPRIRRKGNEIRKRADLTIGALGDGSDYASFLDHAGISALNIGFMAAKTMRFLSLHLRRLLLVHTFSWTPIFLTGALWRKPEAQL